MRHDAELQLSRVLGVFLCFSTIVLYCRILYHQHGFVNENHLTHRLVVLNVRTALLVPAFSICYLISLEFTGAYLFMQLPQSIVQGYATFAFVGLFVHYCGGPEQCLEITAASRAYFPSCIFQHSCLNINKYPRRFYNFVYSTQMILLIVRPLLVVAVIITAVKNQAFASNVISGMASFLVIIGITGLLKLYHVLRKHSKGLNAKTKIIVIKGTIGLVLIEALIEQVLVAFAVIDDAGLSQSVRYYCFGVLVELFILAIMLERIFAHEIKTAKAANQQFAPHIVVNAVDDGVRYIPFCEFLLDVFNFRDLFAPLRFQDQLQLQSDGMTTPAALSRTNTLASPLVLLAEGIKRAASNMQGGADTNNNNSNYNNNNPRDDSNPLHMHPPPQMLLSMDGNPDLLSFSDLSPSMTSMSGPGGSSSSAIAGGPGTTTGAHMFAHNPRGSAAYL